MTYRLALAAFFLLGLSASVGADTQCRVPTGEGTATGQWTLGAGSSMVDAVDETIASADDDTTYIEGADAWRTQSYTFTDFSITSGSINSVYVVGRSYESAIAPNVQWGLRVGSGTPTQYMGSSIDQTGSYANYTETWTQNPDTSSAWVEADVEGSGSNPLEEFDVRCQAGAGAECHLTAVEICVDYNPPGGSAFPIINGGLIPGE